ncbi:MAG: hypothetical protein HOP23_08460 [Methylococcaceae bacterium]|nr:hypothetical protein [Methylococcaceae bacterium]
MNQKQSGSEKLQLQCGKTGVRSIEDFQQVEELLEASGGLGVSVVPLWWKYGTPAIFNVGNVLNPAINPAQISQTLFR